MHQHPNGTAGRQARPLRPSPFWPPPRSAKDHDVVSRDDLPAQPNCVRPAGVPERVRDYCLSVVLGPSLADKLRPPPPDLDDSEPGPARVIERPSRTPALALSEKSSKLPSLGALRDPAARVACLSRFAHHELCAVELFAWALLAFPELPAALRRGFVQTLVEEQDHCRLYLARLEAHGGVFGALPLSDYFWKHAPAIAAAPHGPLAFLCAMGLTLEQANLDFTLMYRDAFRTAGDEETAAVIQRVHDDEIGHVKLAAVWVKKLSGREDLNAYRDHAPFPFALARAKGRRFDASARRKAALSDELVAAVNGARPYAQPARPSSASSP